MESKALQNIIDTITKNEEKIAEYGQIDGAVWKKINYKVRLDWNYYSHRMEGGTLTQAETRSVMVGNIEIQGKPLKDVIEMSGHDALIRELLKVGNAEKRLSEKRIRDIHTAIMHEEEAEQKKKIGQWKTESNMIYSYKDEKINFTPPDEVAEAVHTLLDKTNAYLDQYFEGKHQQHPLMAIAQFHVEYLTIHPFYDGNGRTARVLTNLLLIACGLPPIVIKDDLKERYYQLLGDIQAYNGLPDLLYAFIGERIIETQNLILKALKGDSLEEPDDLDKRIALLERELAAVDPDEEIKERLDHAYIKKVVNDWLGDLVSEAIPVVQKFNRLFKSTGHYAGVMNGSVNASFCDENPDEILVELNRCLDKENRIDEYRTNFRINTRYDNLMKGGLKTFDCNYDIEVKFETIKYSVWVDVFSSENSSERQRVLEDRLLHKPLSPSEISKIVSTLGNSILEHIEHHTKKAGLRPDNFTKKD